MRKWLQQLLCVHWFDEPWKTSYEYAAGPIVCLERRTYCRTVEYRKCSKCGYEDARQVGEPEFLGWF